MMLNRTGGTDLNQFLPILYTKKHNKFYLDRYVKLICKLSTSQVKKKIGLEKHHILPKAGDMFPEYKDFSSFKWNKIILTPREHFLAHWLLWKAFGGSQTAAFKIMCAGQQKQRITSKVFETLKIEMSLLISTKMMGNQYSKGTKHSQETKDKRNNALKGQKRTLQQLENMSKGTKGIKRSEQHKNKMKGNQNGKANKGCIWCYDPITLKNYRVFEIPEGYMKGMVRNGKIYS